MSLLNFKENTDKEEIFYEKNYMKIDEVLHFFNNVKTINIFKRKEIVNNILNNIKNEDLKGELCIDKLKEIAKFSYIFNINGISQKKMEISKKFEQIWPNKRSIYRNGKIIIN